MALTRFCYNVLKIAKCRLEPSVLLRRTYPNFPTQSSYGVHSTPRYFAEQEVQTGEENDPAVKESTETVSNDPAVNRNILIPVETSIKYLASEAYQETYGSNPVWKEYRRNHKGPFPPPKTRRTCIRQGKLSTGNPCPICRDEYLVLDYRNIELLKQFICPHTGSILGYQKTGLCRTRQAELILAIEKARDCGFITYDVPFRVYDYSQYIKL